MPTIQAVADSNAVAMRLDFGTSATGAKIIKTINLSGIKDSTLSNEDYQKIYNIVGALAVNLEYAVNSIVVTSKVLLEETE